MSEPIHIISLGAGVQSPCLLFATDSKRRRGTVRMDGVKMMAHQAAWICVNGTIPPGMCVLHRCDNPQCINPEHLFLGTQDDNMKDMARKGRHVGFKQWDGRTHCKSGHLICEANIYTRIRNGKIRRECRKCRNEATYRYAKRS